VRDRFVGIPGEWSHRRCQNPECGLVWLDPMPLPEELGKLYSAYFTHAAREGSEPGGSGNDLKRRERASLAGALGYAELREGAGSLPDRLRGWSPFVRERAGRSVFWLPAAERGRLLDIGCGNGRFLNRMRSLGWEVAGVDFDAEAVRVAREHYGLDARCGSADAVGFEPASFDVVTLSHVLEHVPDPAAALARCASLLRPGGEILVWVPNFESPFRSLFGAAWFPYEVPRHRWHFRPADVAALLVRAGLAVVEVLPDPTETLFRKSARRLGGALGALLGRRAVRAFLVLAARFARRSDAVRIRAVRRIP
jgi:2-polyprenyl-3-methyl-5-hydroxy-6-metoxy-1,4-benzoquinol methylase